MYKNLIKYVAGTIGYIVMLIIGSTWVGDLLTAKSSMCVLFGVVLLIGLLFSLIVPIVWLFKFLNKSGDNDEQPN